MAFFEELDIWQQAKALTMTTYKDFQFGHDYGFKDQIQRASVSIMNNRSMLYLADELNYCDHTTVVQSIEQCKKITGSINKLINYLNSRK